MSDKKLISIVIPAYKEEKNISVIYNDLEVILNKLDIYNFEIIFVNDWSPDLTWFEIAKLCEIDKKVKWINLSRNFWKELAMTAWLEFAIWSAVITLDADWQHPPEKIPDFISKWEQWYEIVYNKRPKIDWASFVKKLSSKLFYYFFNKISDFKLEESTTDYRLLDRKVVDVFLNFREKNRLYRWLIDWLWFKKIALVFNAKRRIHWEWATYNYFKLYKLALDSVTSFSLFPLKIVGYLWLLITTFSCLIFFIMVLDKIWFINMGFTNLALVVVINTILIWIVLMSLGFMALYIANIHEEVIWRPLYVVREKINVK